MAWYNRAQTVRTDADALRSGVHQATTSAPNVRSRALIPPFPTSTGTAWNQAAGYRELWAMQVPAFNRGVRLISGTVAQLPLRVWSGAPKLNLENPDPHSPAWVTMQRTVRDMILHGVAYWLAVTVDSVPVYRWMPAADATVAPDGKTVAWTDNGVTREYPVSDPAGDLVAGRVIVFQGFRDGVLLTGVQTLTTALEQMTAAGNLAAAPAPTQILKNTSNYELSDTEIDALIDGYTAARQASTVAYLNGGVDLTTFGYNSQDLQLVESSNQSAIQVARLLNLDPFWIGAGVPGSALTYQNRVDMRQDLVDLTLSDYIVPIEQRLSMRDLGGASVRFDTSEFLRSNLDARARMAIDLFAAGIIDRTEAREFVSDRQTGGPAA